jgi:hypothetical protein
MPESEKPPKKGQGPLTLPKRGRRKGGMRRETVGMLRRNKVKVFYEENINIY